MKIPKVVLKEMKVHYKKFLRSGMTVGCSFGYLSCDSTCGKIWPKIMRNFRVGMCPCHAVRAGVISKQYLVAHYYKAIKSGKIPD